MRTIREKRAITETRGAERSLKMCHNKRYSVINIGNVQRSIIGKATLNLIARER